MKKVILFFVFCVSSAFCWSLQAQTSLEGKVTDESTGEGVISATIAVKKGDVLVTGTVTDFDGNYSIPNLDPGTYDVEFSYIGYQTVRQTGVKVFAGKANRLDVSLGEGGINLDEVVVKEYKVPLIEQDNTSTGGIITSEDIDKMPLKEFNAIAATTAGISSQDGGAINIGGMRSGGTAYYIDGMRVTGRRPPQTEIDQLQIITGGVPAQYGDLTGGVISITTKGPSSRFSGGVELETSEFLDPYGYNLLYGNVSGPLIRNKDSNTVVGFRLSTQYRIRRDDNPGRLGIFAATEESIKALEEDPLSMRGSLMLPSGEFYRGEANGGPVQELDARPNEQENQIDITGKLDFRLNDRMDVQLTGTYFDSKDRFTPSGTSRRASGTAGPWDVFNYVRNPYQYSNTYRGIARFRHRLGKQSFDPDATEEEQTKNALIQNAVYTIEAGYEYRLIDNEDLIHENRLFDYGYIGTFRSEDRPFVDLIDPNSPGAVPVTLNTLFGDTVLTFGVTQYTQGPTEDSAYIPNMNVNPILNNYNKFSEGNNDIIARNGFISPVFEEIWGIHTNVGQVYDRFRKQEREIFTAQINSSFDFLPGGSDKGRHNIQFGLFWEQRVIRDHLVRPFELWRLGRASVNSQLDGTLDYSNPIDGATVELDLPDIPGLEQSSAEFQLYNYAVTEDYNENTEAFWKNFRDEFGIPYHQRVFFDAIPEEQRNRLTLGMFNAQELTQTGFNLVDYYGYDHTGKRVDASVTFDDFFATDDNGNRDFLVAPFRPVYAAGYLQDKFTYKDVIFRLGVRVERYDANTRVLKNDRSLYEIQTAQEFHNDQNPRPGNVGQDWLVYVEERGGQSVLGYRDGNTWFDRNGTQTNGLSLFGGSIAQPAYRLDNPDIKDPNYDIEGTFEDYEPQWNILPRLSFSFPISDEANFFANYDILAQRPDIGAVYVSPLQYFYFLDPGRTPLNNPNLRPQKTINYQAGFKQKISNSSSIEISAFYRELRDLIQRQTVLYFGGLNQYDTYGNLDFGTVKEFRIQYDLRRTGNIRIRANYRLQFAEGTGSNADSQRGLTDRGNLRTIFPLNYEERHQIVANIDYRYGSGRTYTGPVLFGKDIFENTGLNVQLTTTSGRPYTPTLAPTQFGVSGGANFAGSINSANNPWIFQVDMRLDRDFTISRGDGKRPVNVNVYFRAENLLNRANVTQVYAFTGSAYNDGFLSQGLGESIVNNFESQRSNIEANEQVYIEAYNWEMLNPNRFFRPRRMYVGAIVNF